MSATNVTTLLTPVYTIGNQDDIPNPCPVQQHYAVKFAFAEAKRRLQRAKKALAEYFKRPDNPRSKFTRDALATHFRWSEDIRKTNPADKFFDVPGKIVPGAIDQLLQNIDKPIAATCYSTSDYTDPNDPEIRGLLAKANWLGTNHFGYATLFFKQDRATQARTIIHEMCHSWLGMPIVAGLSACYNLL